MPVNYSLSNYDDRWWNPYLLNGKTYQVLQAEALIDDFYRYEVPLMEWDKKTIYYCGVEGSGKTNAMRFSTWILNNIEDYVNEGLITILTNDIRILGDKRYSYLFEGIVFVNLLCDDAMGAIGTDSVDYMNKAGRSVSKEFVTSRHIGEEEISNVGVVFMSFATQHWKRLNAVIRDNSTLKIFTSYMDNDNFRNLFPYEETELIREMHHQSHVSTDWRKRSHAICRTGAAGIVHLEIPFVPKNQRELDFCRNATFQNKKTGEYEKYMKQGEYVEDIIEIVEINNEEEFRAQKSHKNKIYLIDRSIDQKTIINKMSTYLRKQPTLNYLIKHHPKLNSLEDFSRGKLYGFLREEAERIVEEFCTDITKSDMLTAIEHALKEEVLELVDAMKKGKIKFKDKEKDKKKLKTYNERIAACFDIRKTKVLHISDFVEITHLTRQKVDSTISKYPNDYINHFPGQGYYSLMEDLPTEQEIEVFIVQTPQLQATLHKPKPKMLKGDLFGE